jgi:hypothetical protein
VKQCRAARDNHGAARPFVIDENVVACRSLLEGWTPVRHQNSRFLFNYWNALRGERPAPERSEVEPGDLRHVLGDTFILEVSLQRRRISYRLAGTRLCAAYGRELKGSEYLAQWREEDGYEIARGVQRVYREFTPIIVIYAAQGVAHQFVEYESLLLPLAPATDGNGRIFGIATPGEHPYWLGAEPLERNHLRHVRAIEQEANSTLASSNFSVHGECGAGESAGRPRRIGHLTIHQGGKD